MLLQQASLEKGGGGILPLQIPIYLADLIFDLATLSVYAAMNLGTNVTKKLDHNSLNNFKSIYQK